MDELEEEELDLEDEAKTDKVMERMQKGRAQMEKYRVQLSKYVEEQRKIGRSSCQKLPIKGSESASLDQALTLLANRREGTDKRRSYTPEHGYNYTELFHIPTLNEVRQIIQEDWKKYPPQTEMDNVNLDIKARECLKLIVKAVRKRREEDKKQWIDDLQGAQINREKRKQERLKRHMPPVAESAESAEPEVGKSEEKEEEEKEKEEKDPAEVDEDLKNALAANAVVAEQNLEAIRAVGTLYTHSWNGLA